jgi:hypothetical protein
LKFIKIQYGSQKSKRFNYDRLRKSPFFNTADVKSLYGEVEKTFAAFDLKKTRKKNYKINIGFLNGFYLDMSVSCSIVKRRIFSETFQVQIGAEFKQDSDDPPISPIASLKMSILFLTKCTFLKTTNDIMVVRFSSNIR